jgi:perosamine synthetase
MNRISDLEKKYVLEALDNEFRTSLNTVFASKLEQQFSKKLNSLYAISHVNGTATMHTALAALGVGKGDEVIVPPLTMSSTALSVLHNQAVPIFADVDKSTFNLDPKVLRKSITTKTKAIITVALYGLSPDYDEIIKICHDHRLFLIEDNAECFLGYYKGQIVGSFGDFSSFSFQASKHMTCGEGGILTTNSEELANKARRFSSLGYAGVSSKKGKISKQDIQNPDYDRHISFGFNYRMSEVNAAVALGQLERLENLVEQRKKVAYIFESSVKNFPFIRPQFTPKDYINSYWTYAIVLEADRQTWFTFRNLFQKNGGDHYYAAWKLSYDEPLFQNIIQKESSVWQKYKPGLCPNAEYLQPRMIQLKTNYWNLDDAKKQADILYKTLLEFSG